MRAIDLFAGWGGMTEGAEQAGIEVVWAANHWKLAVEAHKLNHPNAIHECQDLRQADWSKVPQYDLLLAAPACVPGDATIERKNMPPILAKDVRVGDRVLSSEGRMRRVLNVWSKLYSGRLISLQMWGDTKKVVRMTADHFVWVRRRGGHFNRFASPQFMRADSIREGDYVASPRIEPKLGTAQAFIDAHKPANKNCRNRHGSQTEYAGSKIMVENSESLWWLLGHYLGDGEIGKGGELAWSTGISERNLRRVRTALTKLGLRSWVRDVGSNARVSASSTWLQAICRAFGRYCHEKTIPTVLDTLEHNYVRALICGYFAADGSRVKGRTNPTRRATSTSLQLLQGLQRLCWNVGWSAGIGFSDEARETMLLGRKIKARDTWEMQLIKKPHKQSRTKFLPDNCVWRSVRKIKTSKVVSLEVFDFEVDKDHTFCLPGVVVHNCQGHSNASQPARRKYHDNMRATAWAVVDCAEATSPKAILVENVPQFTNWKLYPIWKGAIEALGYHVHERIINATSYGVPQRRERLFIAATRKPFSFTVPTIDEEPAFGPCIEWWSGEWRPISKTSDVVRDRIARGRKRFGRRFLSQHVTNHPGVGLDEAIRTITTKDQWIVVDSDMYRPLTVRENARGMSFRDNYEWPAHATRGDCIKGLGNAVAPKVGKGLVEDLVAFAA